MKKNTYLVGVDGSEWSNRAADRAIKLAELSGAHVKLISVLDWSTQPALSIEGVMPTPTSMKEEEVIFHKRVIQPIIEKYSESPVDITSEVTWGDPIKIIHEQEKTEHASMLFVGRRGRSRFFDLVLGSVANKLAHYSGIPVVLVP